MDWSHHFIEVNLTKVSSRFIQLSLVYFMLTLTKYLSKSSKNFLLSLLLSFLLVKFRQKFHQNSIETLEFFSICLNFSLFIEFYLLTFSFISITWMWWPHAFCFYCDLFSSDALKGSVNVIFIKLTLRTRERKKNSIKLKTERNWNSIKVLSEKGTSQHKMSTVVSIIDTLETNWPKYL